MENKTNIDIAFLILHYETTQDTEECIDSIIKKIDTENYIIVVVDNNSKNNSYEILSKKYDKLEKVVLIKNEENLGFARGNNIGFKYIKEKYNTKYICMMNNDTQLLQDDFYRLIDEEYMRSDFAVLGPKILLKDGTINPVQERLISRTELKKEICKMRFFYGLNIFHLYPLYENAKKILKRTIYKNRNFDSKLYIKSNVEIRQEMVVLHGCCLIFSEKYISEFDGIDDRTYMYMEEKILFYRIIKNNMKTVYNPDIKIFHKEDSSTNSVMKSDRKKNLFLYKNAVNSAKILYNDMCRDNFDNYQNHV